MKRIVEYITKVKVYLMKFYLNTKYWKNENWKYWKTSEKSAPVEWWRAEFDATRYNPDESEETR